MEAGGGGAGGCVQARGVGVTGCGGARCLGGGERAGVGEGADAPRCRGRRSARLGDSEGRARWRRSGGSGGAPRRGRREEGPGGREMRRRGRAPGEGARGGGRGWAGRLALGRGAELVGPVVGAARGAGGRRGAAAARRPLLPPGLELSGLGGGCSRWEVGAGGGGGGSTAAAIPLPPPAAAATASCQRGLLGVVRREGAGAGGRGRRTRL